MIEVTLSLEHTKIAAQAIDAYSRVHPEKNLKNLLQYLKNLYTINENQNQGKT